jgi:hypothetical protein
MLELSLFIGIVLSGVAAGAQADKIKAKLTAENINTLFIYFFLSRDDVAVKYKDFPSSKPGQSAAERYRQQCLSTL